MMSERQEVLINDDEDEEDNETNIDDENTEDGNVSAMDPTVPPPPPTTAAPPPLPQITFVSESIGPTPASASAQQQQQTMMDDSSSVGAIMDPAIRKIVEDRASRGSNTGGYLRNNNSNAVESLLSMEKQQQQQQQQQHQTTTEAAVTSSPNRGAYHHHHHSDDGTGSCSITFFGKGIPKKQELPTTSSSSSSKNAPADSTNNNNNKTNNNTTTTTSDQDDQQKIISSSSLSTGKNSHQDSSKGQVTGTTCSPGAYASQPSSNSGNDTIDVDATRCFLNSNNNSIDAATIRTTSTTSGSAGVTVGETDGSSSDTTSFHLHSDGSLNHISATIKARLVTMEEEDAEKLQMDNQILRQQLSVIENAPTALVVGSVAAAAADDDDDPQQPKTTRRKRRKKIGLVAGLVLIFLIVVVAAVVIPASQKTSGSEEGGNHEETNNNNSSGNATTNNNNNSSSSNDTTSPMTTTSSSSSSSFELLQPTLQTVRERGYIKCRVSPTDHKRGYGISLELCKAMAAAIFGGDTDTNSSSIENNNRTEFFVTPLTELWDGIDTGRFDIGSSWATNHMGRDVYESKSRRPKSFSIPFYFTGVQVAGHPDFVDCVDRRDTLIGICKDLVICVVRGSSTSSVIQEHFDGPVLHMLEHSSDTFVELASGTSCNVIAGKPQYIYEDRARDAGYTGDYVLGSTFLSREPQSMVLREDDPEWTDFANSILQALFTAERENITKENATLFPLTDLFGEDLRTMYRDVIAAVGNWGDLYDRTFGQTTDRLGMNLLKVNADSNGGLLYSAPLSALRVDDADILPIMKANGTLEAISERGYLRCGVIPNRLGFAAKSGPTSNSTSTSSTNTQAWSGMDVDLCRCLAAALFADPSLVEFVELEDQVAGFMALEEDLVDVFSGATYTLEADIKEVSTHQGYAFSPIYFYDEDTESMLALATNQKSTQWTDYVKWAVYGLIHAEEESIGIEEAFNMPAVDLFGPSHKLMFRLIVLHFGNYGDVYNNNLGTLIPRRGSNLLNDGTTPLINPLPMDQFI